MSNLAVFDIGKHPATPAQFQLMYCNGIESSQEQAMEQASLISKAFNERVVTIVYNFTKVSGYFNFGSAAQVESEAALANFLVEQIRLKLQLKSRVALFAHSHGTEITRLALIKLNPEEQRKLNVYLFGGIAIPKHMANFVSLYFDERDIIGTSANQAYDKEGVLITHLKITKRIRLEGYDRAIINQVKEDVLKEIDPMTPEPANIQLRAYRQKAFVETFFSGQAIDPKSLEANVRKYTRGFTDYNIYFLPLPSEGSEKSSETSQLSCEALSEMAAKEMKTYVTDSDNLCHKFKAFEKEIWNIASVVKFVLETAC